jgi:hypothetical protein
MTDAPARDWLFALLRYAVTREPADQSALLVVADELDAGGARSSSLSFGFFRRTSIELCQTIESGPGAGRSAIIKRHLDRIADDRLRRAFAAAVDMEPPRHATDNSRLRRPELWRGLG